MTADVQSGLRLAVDIGGTFTDVVLLDTAARRSFVSKVLTTSSEPALGVMNGIRQVCARAGAALAETVELVHATTLVTNAVIERRGARTALITTEGFRDLLEMGRETSYDSYDLALRIPTPLVPRHLRFTVRESTSAAGTVLIPAADDEIDERCKMLLRDGVESVAVCFLNAFKNPDNERRVAQRIRLRAPNVAVTTSSEICPEIREYERFTTASVNAYTKPITVSYIDRLTDSLGESGFAGRFFMMQSNGGMIHASSAKEFPVRLIESGPAAGALGVAYYSDLTNHDSVIGFDMGGTTAKVSIVDSLKPWVTPQFEVAREARFKKGSGLPLRVPSVDLIEIGAGGGSIARINELGLLKVGPDSSGSEPGPSCYGLGGREPTVTDADLLLGFLNPEHFAGGEIRLDVAAAEKSMVGIAEALRLSARDAASGIFEIVNESMASAARVHVTEHGRDLRDFSMVAFGGAGPVHAYDLASRLGIGKIIVPLHGGVASAIGLLTASVKLDFIRTYAALLDDTDWQRVSEAYREMEQEAAVHMPGLAGRFQLQRSVDARYAGQGYEIAVSLPAGELGPHRLEEIRDEFARTYEKAFGQSLHGMPVEILNWRLTLTGPAPARFLPNDPDQSGSDVPPHPHHRRSVRFPGLKDPTECPVYRHDDLGPGNRLTGPCLIEQRESTAVVGPGGAVLVDEYMNLMITVGRPVANEDAPK